MAEAPNVNVVANPTGSYSRSDAGATAMQLAQALEVFSPAVGRALDKRLASYAEAELERGKKAAIEDAANWQHQVASGAQPLGRNPWFRRAYHEQAGRNSGRELSAQIQAEYEEWSGRDSDNPHDFTHWLAERIRTHTAGIDDPNVIAGLTPELNALTNNLSVSHAQYTANRREREGKSAIIDAVQISIDVANDERDPALARTFMAQEYERLKQTFYATGVTRGNFDDIYAQAVIDKAKVDLDEDYLDLLDTRRMDGTPPISSKAGWQDKITDARNEIVSRRATEELRRRQTEANERKQKSETLFRSWAIELLETGEVSPETRREVMLQSALGGLDIKEFNDLTTEFRSMASAIDDPLVRQTMDDVPVELQIELFDKGSVQALERARRAGIITDPKLYGELLRMTVSRREGEENQSMGRQRLAMSAAEYAARTAADRGSILAGIEYRRYQENGFAPEMEAPEVEEMVDAYLDGQITGNVDRILGVGVTDRLEALKARRNKK